MDVPETGALSPEASASRKEKLRTKVAVNNIQWGDQKEKEKKPEKKSR